MLQTWGESNNGLLPMNYKIESYMILFKKWGTNVIQLSQAQKQEHVNPKSKLWNKKNKKKNMINAKQKFNKILWKWIKNIN